MEQVYEQGFRLERVEVKGDVDKVRDALKTSGVKGLIGIKESESFQWYPLENVPLTDGIEVVVKTPLSPLPEEYSSKSGRDSDRLRTILAGNYGPLG